MGNNIVDFNTFAEAYKTKILSTEVLDELNRELKDVPDDLSIGVFSGICVGAFLDSQIADWGIGGNTVKVLKEKELTADDVIEFIKRIGIALNDYLDNFHTTEEGEFDGDQFIGVISDKLESDFATLEQNES